MSGLINVVRKAKPFFSKLDEAAKELPRTKGTGKEFMTELKKQPGVKKAEIEDRNLAEIESAPKMTKEQFLKKLEEKPAPEIKEKVLGEIPPDVKAAAIDMAYADARAQVMRKPTLYGNLSQQEEAIERLAKQFIKSDMDIYVDQVAQKLGKDVGSTVYNRKDLVIPGGENYREILLKLPDTSQQARENLRKFQDEMKQKYGRLDWRRAAGADDQYTHDKLLAAEKQEAYRSSHWEDPNVLAHIRVSDRTGPNGEKVLHVEEIQSDWHQAGRKKGYGPKIDRSVEAYYETKDGQRIPVGFGKTKEEAEASIDIGWKNLVDIKYETIDRKIGEGVPDAPFKKNWHELAMKRVMDYATEGGYDKVAITPGREQADRYNLAKYIKSIQAQPVDDGEGYIMKIVDKDGNVIANHRYEKSDLPDQVGKEMAERIVNSGGGKFEGLDLQVGGEGMVGFYDQILPSYINKEYGKYGAKVGTFPLETGKEMSRGWAGTDMVPTYTPTYTNLHSIDITPEMREAIKTKGQPLYQAIGTGAVGSAAMPEEPTETVDPMQYRRGGRVHLSDNLDTMMLEINSRRK